MTRLIHFFVALFILSALARGVFGQTKKDDRPDPQHEQRVEALKLYALGRLCEHDDRLFEALRAYEKAAKLDPKAAPIFEAMIPIYMGLGRSDEAIKATKIVLDIEPGNFRMWYLYGRQLQTEGEQGQARIAFEKAVAAPASKKRPELRQQIFFDLGKLHESANRPAEAIAAYRKTIAILEDPSTTTKLDAERQKIAVLRTAELYETIGKLYVHTKNYEKAVGAFQTAQQKYPRGAGRLHLNLARVRLQQKRWQTALTHLDDYLRFQPQSTDAYEMKIEVLRKLGRSHAVLPWLEKASKNDEHNVGLKLLLARQFSFAGKSASAEKIYLQLVKAAPSVDVYRGLIGLYRTDQRLGMAKAVQLLDQTVANAKDKDLLVGGDLRGDRAQAMIIALRQDAALAKDLVRAGFQIIKRSNPELSYHTVYILAALANQHDMNQEAERFYKRCLQVGTTRRTVLSVYSGLLDALWHQHKYQDIVSTCDRGLRLRFFGANKVMFYQNKGLAQARMRRFDNALASINAGLANAVETQRFRLLRSKARILSNAERYDQAIEECQKILKEYRLPGEQLQVHYLMSNIYAEQKDYANAEKKLQLVLKMDPTHASAHNDLGYFWADQGKNLKKAEALIRKAIELTEEQSKRPGSNAGTAVSAAYIDSLGWVLFRLGEVEAARTELEKAATMPNGDDPVIWDHLGDVYFRLQRYGQARRAWEKALELMTRDRYRKTDSRLVTLKRKLKILSNTQP